MIHHYLATKNDGLRIIPNENVLTGLKIGHTAKRNSYVYYKRIFLLIPNIMVLILINKFLDHAKSMKKFNLIQMI